MPLNQSHLQQAIPALRADLEKAGYELMGIEQDEQYLYFIFLTPYKCNYSIVRDEDAYPDDPAFDAEENKVDEIMYAGFEIFWLYFNKMDQFNMRFVDEDSDRWGVTSQIAISESPFRIEFIRKLRIKEILA